MPRPRCDADIGKAAVAVGVVTKKIQCLMSKNRVALQSIRLVLSNIAKSIFSKVNA